MPKMNIKRLQRKFSKMPKMNIKRLTMLRDHLKSLPADEYYNQGDYKHCGFQKATDIPAFQKLGYVSESWGCPFYKGMTAAGAATMFFGLPYDVAAWLSCGDDYKDFSSPKEMIKKLDATIEGRIVECTYKNGSRGYKITPKKKVLTPA